MPGADDTTTHDTTTRARRRRVNGVRGPRLARAAQTEHSLPSGVRIAGAWSWRLLVIGAVIAVICFLIIQLRLIVIPVLVAVLLSALMSPFVDYLHRRRWPRGLAVAVAFAALVIIIGGLVYLVVWQVRLGLPDLKSRSVDVFDDVVSWLKTGPLQLSSSQIDDYVGQIGHMIQQDSQVLISGALSVGSTVGHLLTGVLLAMFSTLFILYDGKGIWRWIVRIFPKRAQPALDGAGGAGWNTLGSFVRVQILVASIDAVGIGLGAFVFGVPLAVPIAVLVFLGSFVPVVGAVITGAVAIVVALVYNGWLIALIMLGVVLFVQELEGHVLQPLIMGSAVKVHPLAVVLVVAAGTLLAGIPGALFAVPLAAVGNVMVRYISGGSWRSSPHGVRQSGTPLLWQTVPAVPRGLRRPPRA